MMCGCLQTPLGSASRPGRGPSLHHHLTPGRFHLRRSDRDGRQVRRDPAAGSVSVGRADPSPDAHPTAPRICGAGIGQAKRKSRVLHPHVAVDSRPLTRAGANRGPRTEFGMRQFKTAPGVPIGLVCCVVLGLYADAGNTQPTPAGQGQGEIAGTDRQERIAEHDRLKGQASSLERQGRRAKAISASEEALAIERKVLGRRHPDVRASLISLAELYKSETIMPPLCKLAGRSQRSRRSCWETATGGYPRHRGWFELTERLGALNPEDRRRLESQHVEALSFIIISESVYLHDRLVVEAERVLALRRKLLPDLPPLAQSLNTLALLHLAAGDSANVHCLFSRKR